MSTPDFSKHNEEDARLIILKHLAEVHGRRASDTILVEVLDAFGHKRSREWVRTQIRRLEDVGAVTVTAIGSVLIPELRQAGEDHVLRRAFLEGVRKPSATL